MSRLGRNPFDKKPAGFKPLRAAEIVREMNEEAEKASAEAHIRAKVAESRAKIEPESKSTFLSRMTKLLLVDLRAESYVIGIKAYCLSISLLDRQT